MVGHGRSCASSYLANPTSPIPSHCASIVVTSTVRVKFTSKSFCEHSVEYSLRFMICSSIVLLVWQMNQPTISTSLGKIIYKAHVKQEHWPTYRRVKHMADC